MIPTDLRQAFEETHYIVHHQPPFTLRIGQNNPDLDQLLKANGHNCAAFITAWNPMAMALPEDDNRALQTRLEDELRTRSLEFIRGIGQHQTNGWPGEESVMVMGLEAEAARTMCGRFGQMAFVFYRVDEVADLLEVT